MVEQAVALEEQVVALIEEAMEADEGTLKVDQPLDWDSIALVTFMALVDERLEKTISASRLNKCETVRDVITLVSE
ncbi:acyl carrier protein [Pseudomonas sp. NPDC078416]|jgi:acyl carrier protein|uniref:Acyl carrier protein n=2 Tax=Pseudomonas TaxID=286 RepID=A0A1I0JCP9_9PSED|nr:MULTISPECIES: acyl carrier protein [Pseudomonas]MCF7533915.1 acyl carrier protein [Pseudomonas petrae]MCF7540502.1 acyl carrier protein [Pseudomonas petrae]MCF7545401.1 acyl carrier protein [Pseudomonas petrae]MCF7555827.1 acyl carrier protein [Pseudomonas petrae]SEU07115.1 acyl carrier protein [Pseudomonas graminis]